MSTLCCASRYIKQFCSEFTVVHLGKVSHSQYQVTFVLDEINDPIIVDNVTMEVRTLGFQQVSSDMHTLTGIYTS